MIRLQKNEQFEIISDFSPGLVTNIADRLMPPGAAVSLQNADTHEIHGELRSRYAATTVTTLGTDYVCGAFWSDLQDDRMYIAHGKGDTSGDLVSVTFANGTITTIQADMCRWPTTFTEFRGDIFMPYYNGATVYLGRLTPPGTLVSIATATTVGELVSHESRIFYHVAGTDAKIRWCENLDYSTWDADGSIDVFPYDGDQIIGLKSAWHHLYVFKKNHIYIIRGGPADGGTVGDMTMQLIADFGAVSPHSIVVVGNEVWFLARDGVYSLLGSQWRCRSRHIQSEIRGIYRGYAGGNDTGGDELKVPMACKREGKYILACRTGTSDLLNTQYIFDVDRQSVSKQNVAGMCFPVTVAIPNENAESIYYILKDGVNAHLRYQATSGADAEGDFTMLWKSKKFDHDMPQYVKKPWFSLVRFVTDATAGSTITVAYETDRGATGTGEVTSSGAVVFTDIPDYSWIQLTISAVIDAAATTPTILTDIVFKYDVEPVGVEII